MTSISLSEPVSLQIREASSADWPAIWAIIAAVVAPGTTYTLEPEVSEQDARTYWMGEGLTAYVAIHAGQVVGTYAMRANQRGLGSHVANAGFMVRPDAEGQGIGAAMGNHALAQARARGFLAMQFNRGQYEPACHPSLGVSFSVVGTVPRAFRHPSHRHSRDVRFLTPRQQTTDPNVQSHIRPRP